MILDSSGIPAILVAEPEAPPSAKAVGKAGSRRLSAEPWLESAVRIDMAAGRVASMDFDAFLRESQAMIEPVDEEQVRLAMAAYRAYGRGARHPARLTFVDCFSYSLTKGCDAASLFKGDDFSHTDLTPAAPAPAGLP